MHGKVYNLGARDLLIVFGPAENESLCQLARVIKQFLTLV